MEEAISAGHSELISEAVKEDSKDGLKEEWCEEV